MTKKCYLFYITLFFGLFFNYSICAAGSLPQLYIDSIPKNAKVIIWNVQPSFVQGMQLLPGDYDVQVQATGYQPHRQTVHLNKTKRLKVNLSPKLYPLNVSLNIPKNQAKIIIWNIEPEFEQGMLLPSGEYKLQVQAAGYQTYAQTIELKDKPLNWSVELQPSKAASASATYSAQAFTDAGDLGFPLYVDPKEAEVKILNIKPKFSQGMRLLAGRYHLEIKYKNYDVIDPWIEIKDGTVYIELVTEKDHLKVANSMKSEQTPVLAGYYRLNITTKPADAEVQLFNIQKIYQKGMALKPGRYTLHIIAPNKPMHESSVEIIDQDIDVHIEL